MKANVLFVNLLPCHLEKDLFHVYQASCPRSLTINAVKDGRHAIVSAPRDVFGNLQGRVSRYRDRGTKKDFQYIQGFEPFTAEDKKASSILRYIKENPDAVSVDVQNTGNLFGKEVVQLYVAPQTTGVLRPDKELKGFEKVALRPGQKTTVTFTLDKRAFAYWNTEIHDWYVQEGEYGILIGKSSRDIVCRGIVQVHTTREIPKHYDENSLFGDLLEDAEAKKVLEPYWDKISTALGGGADASDAAKEAISEEMTLAMLRYMPLRGLRSFGGDSVAEEELQHMITLLNEK